MADTGTTAPGTVEGVTSQGIMINLTQELAAAKGDQAKIDKAYRNAKLAAQRLDGMDKGKEWLIKSLDTRSEVFNKLVKTYQDLSVKAAENTVDNDQTSIKKIIDLLAKQQDANFNLDLMPENAKGGMYAFAGTLAALCELCNFKEGADYLNGKIEEWRANNQVNASTEPLSKVLGTLSPKTDAAKDLARKGTDQALVEFRNNVAQIIEEQSSTYNAGVANAPAAGAVTGAPVGGGDTNPSKPPAAATPPEAAASATLAAQMVIKKAALDSKVDSTKIDALTKVYRNAAGADGLLDANEAKVFMSAPVVKELKPEQLQNIEKALVHRHMAIEGTFTR